MCHGTEHMSGVQCGNSTHTQSTNVMTSLGDVKRYMFIPERQGTDRSKKGFHSNPA